MKALTIHQPYAGLIASGAKRIENRGWPTSYRGWVMIHAGKSTDWLEDPKHPPAGTVFGAVVAVARIVACLRKGDGDEVAERAAWARVLHLERFAGLYDHEHALGPWCWVLDAVAALPVPVPCNGAQGLWTPSEGLQVAVDLSLERP